MYKYVCRFMTCEILPKERQRVMEEKMNELMLGYVHIWTIYEINFSWAKKKVTAWWTQQRLLQIFGFTKVSKYLNAILQQPN